MIVKPKIRGFVCITAHPEGCEAHVQEQIRYVKSQPPIAGPNAPKNVLIIGASTGYGLASRIALAFGAHASTVGVFFERPSQNGKPASAGWYNAAAFEKAAHAEGLYAKSFNGDAFSHELKDAVIKQIKEDLEQIDLVIYSLASPRRTDPNNGETYKSALKPVGETFQCKTLDTDKKVITDIQIDPANEDDIEQTRKVMGGEDWELWMDALGKAGVLSRNATTVAYSYIGPEQTWPIYKNGTIGLAKEDLEKSAKKIHKDLEPLGGRAYVPVNKALVTQASSAIPVVPLYISLLYKVMKDRGTHEGCIEQMVRLFRTQLYSAEGPELDPKGRVRVDDWEMAPEVQQAVATLWPKVTTETLEGLSDFKGYQHEFMKLFGFDIEGVDYEKDVEVEVSVPSLQSANISS